MVNKASRAKIRENKHRRDVYKRQTVYNMEGNEVGTMELNDAVFGVEVNEHLVHLAVVDVYKRQEKERTGFQVLFPRM